VKIWEAQSGFLILTIHADPWHIVSASFSPDGRKIVTSGFVSPVRVWDVFTGKPISNGPNLRGVRCRFTPDGEKLLIETNGLARTFDLKTSKFIPGPPIRGYEPNETITQGSALFFKGGSVRDRTSGKLVSSPDFGKGKVLSSGFSADDSMLVAGGSDGKATVCDAASGKRIRSFPGNPFPITQASFSSDGKRLLFGGPSGDARIWDFDLGKIVGVVPSPVALGDGTCESCSFSPDGSLVMVAKGRGAEIWRATGTKRVSTLAGDTTEAWFLEVKGSLIEINESAHPYIIWNLISGRQTALESDDFPEPDPYSGVLMDPPTYSHLTQSTDKKRLLRVTFGGSAQVLDNRTGRPLAAFALDSGHVGNALLFKDSDNILVEYDDGAAKIYRSSTGKELCTVLTFNDGAYAITDPAGRYDGPDDGHIGGLHWIRNGTTPMGLDQLRFAYYTPGLLQKILSGAKLPEIPK